MVELFSIYFLAQLVEQPNAVFALWLVNHLQADHMVGNRVGIYRNTTVAFTHFWGEVSGGILGAVEVKYNRAVMRWLVGKNANLLKC